MGWFDGGSTVSLGRKASRSPARSSKSSRHGGSRKHTDHYKDRKSKLTTGSAFGDWAAGVNRSGRNKSSASLATSHIDVVDPPKSRPYDGHKNRSTASFFSLGSKSGKFLSPCHVFCASFESQRSSQLLSTSFSYQVPFTSLVRLRAQAQCLTPTQALARQ